MKWKIKRNPFWKNNLSTEEMVRALLWNRNVRNKKDISEFLNPLPPDNILVKEVGVSQREINKAKKRIAQALFKKEKIIVYGDYDVDGLCGAAIVWEGLYELGAGAIPYIPDRIKDGYGLNSSCILELKNKFPGVKLVVAVDNGIVANKETSKLKEEGIDVIIVDHHLPGESLPEALAIVHTTKLSGSGVAWLLMRELKTLGVEIPDLGLAALGTVADMLPVIGANRSIVKFGIPFLETTRRVGLRRLFEYSGIKDKPLDTYKISYIIAPRLNALGRIANSLDGLRLLCSRRLEKGESLAKLAQQVNSDRQKMTMEGITCARDELKKLENTPFLIFSASSMYHQGIVGLIAGRLTEEFYRPSVVISQSEGVSHGSARSIPELNIMSVLNEARALLLDVGGHPMAAGFSIESKNIVPFERKVCAIVKDKLKGKKLVPNVQVDGKIALSQVTGKYYKALSSLAPFGLGNPEPLFMIEKVRALEVRTMGEKSDHLKLFLDDPATPEKEKLVAESVGFYLGHWSQKILAGDLIDVVGYFTEDNWGGRTRIVFRIKDLRKR